MVQPSLETFQRPAATTGFPSQLRPGTLACRKCTGRRSRDPIAVPVAAEQIGQGKQRIQPPGVDAAIVARREYQIAILSDQQLVGIGVATVGKAGLRRRRPRPTLRLGDARVKQASVAECRADDCRAVAGQHSRDDSVPESPPGQHFASRKVSQDQFPAFLDQQTLAVVAERQDRRTESFATDRPRTRLRLPVPDLETVPGLGLVLQGRPIRDDQLAAVRREGDVGHATRRGPAHPPHDLSSRQIPDQRPPG
jgi:hypothetical protein